MIVKANVEDTTTRRSSRVGATPVNYVSPGRTSSRKPSGLPSLQNEWQWLCGSCVATKGAELIGSEVKVWWHHDECAYEGIVNAFDEISGSHRVLYQDNEWEFVQLQQEVYLIKPNV